MEFKKLLTILTLTVIILVACVLGGTLAWYSLTNSSTSFNTTTAAQDDLKITYQQTANINTTAGAPIAESDVATKASHNEFNVSAGDALTGYNVSIEVALTDIDIADELKIDDFKYQLLENSRTIKTGTGSDFATNVQDGKLVLKSLSQIEIKKTYNYVLRVWLQDNGGNQNGLMNKAFKAKIQIISSIKK